MLNLRAMLASMNFVGGAMTPSLVYTRLRSIPKSSARVVPNVASGKPGCKINI